ncbi:NAD-glutamate dehydrogenase [Jatrophihabitans cynanchi]|jgi:glutamate dehydrogenase|uniref:NAD-glutamate dehydrogenase n=1 Tax=Jatrophihabitans cynanchi TaxID=2944128 RepID=A0ABY7JRX9_9ACTN|nr:NAD-glutamate dehydrogenase [Jatrophihabitans sp. SB3-54]WAX55317.1 NAD-glutamate dehydrogenase [Jatrophihabitans sp. SB3-54]
MTETRPGTPAPSGVDADTFARRFLAHAGSQLPGRDDDELEILANENLAFGAVRRPGETLLRLRELDADTSAIEIVTSDAAFLVDSVRAELQRCGRPAERVLHPQVVVRRDSDGALIEVLDIDDNADVPPGALVESWMYIELDAVPAEEQPVLADDVRRVLADVHHALDDAPAMYARLRQLADALSADPGEFDRETSAEAGALLRWLADGNYMILGHAAYSANELASPRAQAQDDDAEGVLRGAARISPLELLPAYRSGAPLVIFKSPLVSTVRRSVRYDCVTVVTQGDGKQMIHVFLGLITNAEDGLVGRVPVVRRRIAEILLRSGVRADSHTGRQLLAALRTLPRDELLEAPTGDLLRLAQLVVNRAEQKTVGVFARIHLNRDFVSVLVYFPADRFGPETRRRVTEVISRNWPGEIIGRDDRIVELDLARMQFLIAVRPGTQPPSPDRPAVEVEVAAVTRRWSDDLRDLLVAQRGEEAAERLIRMFTGALPEGYKEDFDAAAGARDLITLDELPREDGLAFQLYTPTDEDEDADRRLKVFRTGQAVTLARALPIFTQMGIEVLDERPYEIALRDAQDVWIYDFGLRLPAGVDFDEERSTAVIDALRLLWREQIEQDGFNALVVRTGMSWWQANILRAYAKYLRQAGTTFSQGYIEQALVEHAALAEGIVELFEARFDPGREGQATEPLVERIEAQLAEVASLDQDHILRSLLALVRGTLRTNAYRLDDDGNRRTALAMKLDPREIPDLPEPRPRFEIWVYSPRVEGVHLRFGAVARGGLRWSDRREDFRTEVLGLVKAQMVKNAVIVPTGSKGGFVPKQLPDPADRDAWLAEGIACYRMFISCLLDVTDNYVTDASGAQTIVPPPQTRRYDGDDPYLVVAADKGTATFSDIANGISADYGFWLGDAFASGGSVGYDHKAMGITARGAWESVKYHFRELGLDTQTQDFTVVGIGDMSGDVFGNGMLLSEHIRLVAAFDHRHVFLDPDPDAASSFAERRRLYGMPRSSWADYDTSLISAGGGVYPRTLKAIPISPQVAARLGLPATTSKLTPTDLIHAILLAPVDLLWNGGIGTYVKASTEPQTAAGDKANDALRANGAELRARVVGEGGNLGFTQLGRIEYARAGGQINTDAIDNSAGVDTSDHEVNLKILLNRSVAAGTITVAERNDLLASVTEDVAAHVLRDNYEQNVLLGMARKLSPALISVHQRFIQALETAGELDRTLEFLPSDKEIAAREAEGIGLVSPENSVLVAYSKMTLTRKLESSTLPDEPWFRRALAGYFPPAIASRFADELDKHPLQREIITTVVVNDMINRSGTTFVHRAIEETGGDAAEITRAYSVVREVFGLGELWAELESLDNKVPTDAQHAGYQEIRRLVDRATRWLVDVRFPISDVAAEIDRFGPTLRELGPRIAELVRGAELADIHGETARLVELGLPTELATTLAQLLSTFLLLDVVEIANASEHSPAEIAELHFALSDQFYVDEMLTAVTALPRDDRWTTLARAAMRHDVYAALSAITTAVLRGTDDALSADDRTQVWSEANIERVERARSTVRAALDRDTIDLATLSVALRVMRGLPT